MNEVDKHYPAETCPFCTIAAAYPYGSGSGGAALWESKKDELSRSVPAEEEVEEGRTEPSSFVVLRGKGVVAFLDIAPMVRGMLFCCSDSVSRWKFGCFGCL
jgi:hypothetical protein